MYGVCEGLAGRLVGMGYWGLGDLASDAQTVVSQNPTMAVADLTNILPGGNMMDYNSRVQAILQAIIAILAKQFPAYWSLVQSIVLQGGQDQTLASAQQTVTAAVPMSDPTTPESSYLNPIVSYAPVNLTNLTPNTIQIPTVSLPPAPVPAPATYPVSMPTPVPATVAPSSSDAGASVANTTVATTPPPSPSPTPTPASATAQAAVNSAAGIPPASAVPSDTAVIAQSGGSPVAVTTSGAVVPLTPQAAATAAASGTPTTSGDIMLGTFDLSQFVSGTQYGIPGWAILAAVAVGLFFMVEK